MEKETKVVIVASENPVKIKTVETGFLQMFPDENFRIIGVSANSGIRSQPLSEAETLLGAFNRVEYATSKVVDADYWVGIEGGVEDNNGELESFAWIIVKSKDGKVGRGRTGSFFLPRRVAELIREGKELGEADDIVFNKTNSKQANGAVGILTGDILTRGSFYIPAVVLALIPFRNHELYNH